MAATTGGGPAGSDTGWGRAKTVPRDPLALAAPYLPTVPLGLLLVALALERAGAVAASWAPGALVAYAAVLLAFLAGARWGAGLRATGMRASIAGAAVPPLLGWAALLLPAVPGTALVAAALAGQGALDVWTADRGDLPGWYAAARIRLTLAAVAILVAAFLVMAV